MRKNFKILLTGFTTIFLLLGFAVPVNMVSNWYQQFMPNLGSQQINDIFFLDSLNGFAVASRNVNPDTVSILKTTNGGDNWQIIFSQTPKRFTRLKFINQNTGFVCGGSGGGTPNFYKTTNGGTNWLLISTTGCALWKDMSVMDENNIWLVDDNSLCGGVYYTSDGGLNWTPQFSGGTQNPNKIYMYNARIGFMTNSSALPNIYKTTNGGGNWNINVSGEYFTDMHFIDSLTGWYSYGTMKKTINGGISWNNQILPSGGLISAFSIMKNFSIINKDTIWGGGGYLNYGGGRNRGFLYYTSNGGSNWLFQIPDTGYQIPEYDFVNFINKKIGWAYNSYYSQQAGVIISSGVHSTTGGNDTFLLGLKQISTEIPREFKLYQNYPNPFNPRTIIKYQITKNKYQKETNVKLIVFDITGKEVITLVNQKQSAGTYEIDFLGIGYSSGVYFYSLIINNKIIGTKKIVLVK